MSEAAFSGGNQEGVLLRPRMAIAATRNEDVGTSLDHQGPRVPDEHLGIDGLRYVDAEVE